MCKDILTVGALVMGEEVLGASVGALVMGDIVGATVVGCLLLLE